MLTPSTNRLTIKVIGAITPCHSPPQKPAGSAPRSLYLEFHPATEREFGMEGCKYIKRTPARATDVPQVWPGPVRETGRLERGERCGGKCRADGGPSK